MAVSSQFLWSSEQLKCFILPLANITAANARDLCAFECLLVVCRRHQKRLGSCRQKDLRSKIVTTIWKIFRPKFGSGGSCRWSVSPHCVCSHVHKALYWRRFIGSDEMTPFSPLANRRTVVYLVALSSIDQVRSTKLVLSSIKLNLYSNILRIVWYKRYWNQKWAKRTIEDNGTHCVLRNAHKGELF